MNTPTMHPVKSSQILSIGHDPSENILFVTFIHGGATYMYQNVEEKQFNELLESKSVGKLFSSTIKGQAKHPFKKLEAKEVAR